MAKTSIFSSKYEKKQRRKKALKRAVFFVLLMSFLVLFFRAPLLEVIEKVKQDIEAERAQKEELLEEIPDPIEEVPEEPEEPEETSVAQGYDLPVGVSFVVELSLEDGERSFNSLEELNMEWDVSPSKKQAIVLEPESQDLFLLDVDGGVVDITYKVYENDRGGRYPKESILSTRENFVWAETPMFLDEDTVVFMSQLPWFDQRRAMYVIELDPLSHRFFYQIVATGVRLLGREEAGILYEIGEQQYILTPDYNIIRP